MAFNWPTFPDKGINGHHLCGVDAGGIIMESLEFFDVIFRYSFWLLVGIPSTD